MISTSRAITFVIIGIAYQQVSSLLTCYAGLGNTSQKYQQKLVACPDGNYYVCVKMFGGGMGDQIQRYCDKMPKEKYSQIIDEEDRRDNGDPNVNETVLCHEMVHNGRDVHICYCSTDKCNGGTRATVGFVGLGLAAAMTFLSW